MTVKLTHEHRSLLKPHAKHYQEMASYLRDSSPEELEALREACDAASSTNCAWDIYRAAQYLKIEIAEQAGYHERRAKERALGECPPPQEAQDGPDHL